MSQCFLKIALTVVVLLEDHLETAELSSDALLEMLHVDSSHIHFRLNYCKYQCHFFPCSSSLANSRLVCFVLFCSCSEQY